MQPPYTYEFMNIAAQGTPSPAFIHVTNTGLARFFKRYLIQDALSIFDWTLPETWDQDYFRYILLGWGFLAVFKTDIFGVIPQQCTLSGYNVFYRPRIALVANPLIQAREMLINEDCVIIKMQPDYCGISDLIDNYGNLMALTMETATTNILNSKLSFVFTADDKQEADTYKALYDAIASGDPAVVLRKRKNPAVNTLSTQSAWNTFQQNVGQNFIANNLLELLHAERDMFLSQIGIPTLSTRKKERVNIEETEKNNIETFCKAELWLNELKIGIKQAIELFPELDGKFDVKLKYKREEDIADVTGANINTGIVL